VVSFLIQIEGGGERGRGVLLGWADLFDGKKKKPKSVEEEDAEWRERFGLKGAKVIREVVDKNVEDYEYMKQFCLKV